jgi:hypothetical protein
MNATPRHRSAQAEREELARLLPAAADPELPRGRHLLLKEHLMETITANSRRAARRRSLTLRLALPVGLAAAVAGVALAAAGHVGTPAGSRSPVGVGDVAYTVQSTGDDTVRLTVLDPSKRVDVTRLQHDLDRLGVRSHVYAGARDCTAPAPKSPHDDSAAAVAATNGGSATRLAYYGWDISSSGTREVLTIRPSRIPSSLRLYIYFPDIETAPAGHNNAMEAGLMQNPAPTCMPAEPYANPLAGQWPSSTPTSPPTATH